MKKLFAALLIPLIVIIIIIVSVVGSYNGLVKLDEKVESSWSQVKVVLKRRADLIPNLVNTVKGYADHEEKVFSQIAEARSRMNAASSPEELAEANEELTRGLNNLNVVVENYPELKANQGFLELQAELASTENKIATERTRYNDSVKLYNDKIRRLPTKFFAGMLGFERREYLSISESDSEVPDVDF